MRQLALVALGAGLLMRSSPATAQGSQAAADGLVIEVYTAEDPARRPPEAESILNPLFEELQSRGFDSRGRLGADVSRVWPGGLEVSEDDVENLGAIVNAARSAYSGGRWSAAETEYQRALDIAWQAPTAVIGNDARLELIYKALLGRAMALKRLGKDHEPAAELMVEEAIRAFPGLEPSRYGAEVVAFWQKVRNRLAAEGTGTLVVECSDPSAVIFVNLNYSGSRSTTKTDLLRGDYHVFAQAEGVAGRAYSVQVEPGHVSRLEIDWAFDTALRTAPYVGFEFDSRSEHREHRFAYPARLAQRLGKARAIAVGVSKTRWGYAVWGFVVDASGRPQREGYVWIPDPSTSDDLVRGFAGYLAGDARAAEIQTEPFDPTAPRDVRHDRKPSTTVGLLGAATAGLTVGAISIGLAWSYLDETCTNGGSFPCQIHETKSKGIATISAGVALSGLTGYLVGRYRAKEPRALRGKWLGLVGGASFATVAAGAGLIAADEPTYIVQDGVAGLRPTHRPTLAVGSIVTTVGALGLGFTIYSAMGPDEPRRKLLPSVSVTEDGAVLGLAGSF